MLCYIALLSSAIVLKPKKLIMKKEAIECYSSLYTQTEDPTCITRMVVGTNIIDTTHEVFFLDITSECRKKYEKLCPGMVISAKMSAVQLCSQNLITLSKVCMISDPQVYIEGFDKCVEHCLDPVILTIRRKGLYMPLAEVQKHMRQNS